MVVCVYSYIDLFNYYCVDVSNARVVYLKTIRPLAIGFRILVHPAFDDISLKSDHIEIQESILTPFHLVPNRQMAKEYKRKQGIT